MKYILTLLITLFTVQAIAQPTPTYTGSYTQMSYNRGSVGALRLQYIPRGFYPFPTFDTLGTIWVDSAQTRGLFYHNGTVRLRLASVPYVDSIAASIEAGSVDSSIYSTVTRLADSLHNLRDYVDSNNTIIYAEIDTANLRITDAFDEIGDLQSEFTNVYDSILVLDSAIGVAFGAISSLYDTLPSYVPYTGATGNVNLGTHTISAYNGVINHVSGSGTALSVTKGGNGEALTVTKTSGSGNAMSVTGGVTLLSELHTTTAIADAYIASAATWNAKGTVNSVATGYGLTGGTITNTGTISADSLELATKALVKKQIDSVAALSGGGGGSPTTATAYQVLYQSGTDTIKSAAKVGIDTTDNRLVFLDDTTTSTVNAFYDGGTKIVGSNRMGMSAVRLVDTVAIPAALQRALNAQITSTITGVAVGLNTFDRTGSFLTPSNVLFSFPTTGTYTPSYSAYNATIQQLNYVRGVVRVAAGANQVFWIRVGNSAGTSGIICGNTKFSGGGGRGTFMFSLPTYASGERIFVGYSTNNGVPSQDPSTLLNNVPTLGVGKDAADTTLQFMHATTTGLFNKINTGIVPNNEDVYRVTVYVSPSSNYYIQLEVLNKNGTTVRGLNPTTRVPAVGTKLVMLQYLNSAATGVQVEWGQILTMEEIY